MKRGLTFAITAVAAIGAVALFAAATVPSGSTVLETVEHDRHLWVIERSSRPMHFVHHPDCSCQAAPRERTQ